MSNHMSKLFHSHNESEDGFILVQSRKQKRMVHDEDKIPSLKYSEKYVICPYLLNGLCRHGLDGQNQFNNKKTCIYNHPKVCSKLLNYGVGGPAGCRVRTSGCRKGVHPKILF